MKTVLTPLAAAALFGKSGEAIRLAAREGKVETPVTFQLGEKPIRCIDLQSALAYWNFVDSRKDPGADLERELDQMRFWGITVTDSSGLSYRVLCPFPAMQR